MSQFLKSCLPEDLTPRMQELAKQVIDNFIQLQTDTIQLWEATAGAEISLQTVSKKDGDLNKAVVIAKLEKSDVFKDGRVNITLLDGPVPYPASAILKSNLFASTAVASEEVPILGLNISVFLEPINPKAPACNIILRFIVQKHISDDKQRPCGGLLTFVPVFPSPEDISLFQDSLKELCKSHGENYEALKDRCNKFYGDLLKEIPGLGGIYFDKLQNLDFLKDGGAPLSKAYLFLLKKHLADIYTPDDLKKRDLICSKYNEFIEKLCKGFEFGRLLNLQEYMVASFRLQ